MKRFIITCQIIIIILFIVKISCLVEFSRTVPFFSTFLPDQAGIAIAQTPATSDTPVKEGADDPLQRERYLLSMLQQKQKDLDARETTLKSEEQRMLAMKKEIIDKIELLKSLETRLAPKLDNEKSSDTKRVKELAKVYEAVPPQKAAAMLEKLELKTAAGITISMKRDRAGLIWGYLTPQKAVEITNQITKTALLSAD
jgi:flagellar motility protein MotE (MotC chaperone)